MNIPDYLIYPLEHFAQSFRQRCDEGTERMAHANVAFIGLARNCAVRLAENLGRLQLLAPLCKSWRLHIETNDNTDATEQVLIDYCALYPQATFTSQALGREQFSTEFAGRRTIALAEYRDACQRWVRDNAADCDYVVAIDWDQWGGWSHAGVLNGFGWLVQLQGAYGMASVSLLEHAQLMQDKDLKPIYGTGWVQYDAWALRLNSTWDDYTHGMGGWKHQWVPPVGSPPVKVCSAFGGMVIYRTEAFLQGTYDGTTDCEHVAFHDGVERATGQHLYLNPSQRCVMAWMLDEGQHGNH